MIDGARPRDRPIGVVALDQPRRQAKARPAVFADGAVERARQRPLARRARRLEER